MTVLPELVQESRESLTEGISDCDGFIANVQRILQNLSNRSQRVRTEAEALALHTAHPDLIL